MSKLLLIILIKIRWLYFHLNPVYIKFYIDPSESYFQHRKTGEIHCNLKLVDHDE